MEQLTASIEAFGAWFGAPITSVAISAIYFVKARTLAFSRRLAISAHGILLAAIYFAAGVIYDTGNSNARLVWPFLAAFLVPTVSIVLALCWYPRNKALHLLLIPLLYCALWIAFIGAMAVTGDWL